MANTQPAQFSYSLVDELGVRASTRLPAMLDPAMTVAQMVTATTHIATLLDAITEGQIVRGAATLDFGTLGAKEAPGADSRVDETGVFDFNNAVTARVYGHAVPSFQDSKLTGTKINLADADVAAYVTALTAAITGGGVYTNEARQALSSLRDAFLSSRKHRAQLTRATKQFA